MKCKLISDPAEIIDWDVLIESPPPRPSQVIMVKFSKDARRKPKIVDELPVLVDNQGLKVFERKLVPA